jgi:crotonobetainyl-CoA:carnitine CoA-transferase CaiB-like acyl-CoA transferase
VHFAELIEGWVLELCSRYTRQEFFAEAQRRRVPCGPVNSPADLLTDPQLEAVGAWVEVAHPDVKAVRLPRSPVRFDGVALPVGPVPAPGEHGVAVLREVVGLTDDQIATLLDEGVLAAGISPRSA